MYGCGWLLYPIGAFILFVNFRSNKFSINLGIAILMSAIFLISIDQNTRRSSRPWANRREQLGVMLYVFSFCAFVFASPLLALPLAGLGFLLSGLEPLRRAADFVKCRLVSINGERWVDFFGLVVMTVGGIIFVVSLLGMAFISFNEHTIAISSSRGHGVSSGGATLLGCAIGACGIALGYGIRRRAFWAGLLGMCLTFWGFMDSLNKAFIDTGGDLTRCPETILKHSFEIMINWGFFFGFYSVFFPSITSRIKTVTDSLEGKLRDADSALTDTRRRLDRAEDQRARTERDLDEERIKFRALYEAINEGIIIFDLQDTALYINPAYAHFYGIKREEWIGKKWPPIFERPGIECHHIRPIGSDVPAGICEEASRRIKEGEVILRDEKGNLRRRVAYYTKIITDSAGEFLAFMGLSRDVTLEREIDRMKTEFVSNVSHELRTPLTSIRAYTEMLLDGEADNPETRSEYLQIILDESERLTNLINDVLDLSKMEAGKKVYKFARNDPAAIARKVAVVCASSAEAKGLSFSLEIPESPQDALCDHDLIHQAILNVTNNAIKYTPSGGSIVMRLTRESQPSDASVARETWAIHVIDTGQGISPEDQKKLFNKFFRVENTLNQDIGGTGLGLALVKQIVMVHQGEVGVESELGKGSTFTLRFPREFNPAV